MNIKTVIKISSISGILLPFVFLIGLLISIIRAPWFNWTEYAISDLGKIDVGFQSFNITLFFVGVLLLIFSFGLYYSLKTERISPTILAISSLYFIAVGIYPLPSPIHIDFSGLLFISFPLSFFTLGIQLYKKKEPFIKKMAEYALIMSVVSACSPIFLLFNPGIAIPEMIILVPGFFWCCRYGLYMQFSQSI